MKLIGIVLPFIFCAATSIAQEKGKSPVYDLNMTKKNSVPSGSSSGAIQFNMSTLESQYKSFYSAEIQQEMDQSGFFKPQGEFEKKEMYAERQKQAAVFLQELNKKYEAKYKYHLEMQKHALQQKIKNSYKQISLEISEISRYDPDGEFFTLKIKNWWERVKVPLVEAESLKTGYKQAKVSADMQLSEDGITYDTFNIKIAHPFAETTYPFGPQRDPLYLAQIQQQPKQGNEKTMGVPELKIKKEDIRLIEPSGNALLDASEAASIEITVRNEGLATATGLHTNVNPSSYPEIEIKKPIAVPAVEPGKSAKIIIHLIAGSRLATGEINLNISFSEDHYFPPRTQIITIQTQGLKPPKVVLKEYGIREVANGNGNNIIEKGEIVELSVVLENTGELSAESLESSIICSDKNIIIIEKDNLSTQSIEKIGAGEKKMVKYTFSVNHGYSKLDSILPLRIGVRHRDAPEGSYLPLKLTMREASMAVENLKFTGIYGLSGQRKDYALFFAVNKYDKMESLQNPISDAESIAKELEEKYGFKTEVIRNPTLEAIDSKITEYQQRYQQNLNTQYHSSGQLLIFFTGHGMFENNIGYFLPKDADPARLRLTGFSYPLYRKTIDEINCNHILVAIDACYSGTFDDAVASKSGDDRFKRSGELTDREKIVNNHLKYITRRYFTSGAKVETPDKSSFAKKFLEALRTHQSADKLLSEKELFGTYLSKAIPSPLMGEFGKDDASSSFLFIMK